VFHAKGRPQRDANAPSAALTVSFSTDCDERVSFYPEGYFTAAFAASSADGPARKRSR
jgi:hypothetical protein